ncbi:sensor histidine kinase [Pedobacter namyangjuensis]|uniref:sensor histidine kinase n=1 Tax=Pedobacter namyangjuensis TaxID=600626 RepID=UPI000DE2D752|nr:HAMP domain-containing sensor histidine kinase [Pedobacter namyangjuensis]
MKLINYTLKYLSIALLLVLSVWAVLFYFRMISEIQNSLDDGLENNKMLVIKRVNKDAGIIERSGFSEHNYQIKEISGKHGLSFRDNYRDTLMWTLNDEEMEPFRMLSTVFTIDDKYYEMKIVASTVGEDDLVESLLYGLILLYVAILSSVLLINNLLIRKVWTSFYQLLRNLRAFRLDKDEGIKTTKTEVREFRELNDSLVVLAEHSVNTYRYQKQFIENASHELQTPLAISLNRLELLAEDETLTNHQLDAIGQVMSTLQRLIRLNKSLLLLSKIENRQYGAVEVVSVVQLVKSLINEYDDYAETKGVEIELIEEAELNYAMNKDLAAILISNLLKNAVIHNYEGGNIIITIKKYSLTISNTGKTVPLNEERIFSRFQKDSKNKNSTGLGLSIVKAITNLYNYQLNYTYSGRHNFTILFKKAV